MRYLRLPGAHRLCVRLRQFRGAGMGYDIEHGYLTNPILCPRDHDSFLLSNEYNQRAWLPVIARAAQSWQTKDIQPRRTVIVAWLVLGRRSWTAVCSNRSAPARAGV